MTNNNVIPKTETIYELKSEIPSFEEFLKTYQSDEKVINGYESEVNSYSDLGKGYGPCSDCGDESLTFRLRIKLESCMNASKSMTVHKTSDAEREAREIRNGTGHWKGTYWDGYFSQSNRNSLAKRIIEKVEIHNEGNSVDTSIGSKDGNNGGSGSSREILESWADKNLREGWGETNYYR